MATESKYLCANGCGVIGAVFVRNKPLCWKCYLCPEDYRRKFEAKGITYRMSGRNKNANTTVPEVQKDKGTSHR